MKNQMIRKGLALLLLFSLTLSLAACGESDIPVVTPDATKRPDTTPETSAQPTRQPESEAETTAAGNTDLPVVIGKAEAADLMESFTAESVAQAPADERFRADLFRFASEIFTQIYSRDDGNKTTLVSPLSILTALSATSST